MPSKDRCAACAYEHIDMDSQPCKQCLDDVSRNRGYTQFSDTAYFKREAEEFHDYLKKVRNLGRVQC